MLNDDYYDEEDEEESLDEMLAQHAEEERERREEEKELKKVQKKIAGAQKKRIKQAAKQRAKLAAKKAAQAAAKIARQVAMAIARAIIQAIASLVAAIVAAVGWIGIAIIVVIIIIIIIIGPVMGLIGGGGPTGNPIADARVGSAPAPIVKVVTVALGSTVFFDGSTFSSDPDGAITLYEWDFDGDGTYDWNNGATGITNYVYPAIGNFTPRLKVTDNDGKTDTDTVTVNIVPVGVLTATITSPLDGQSFTQGTNITFTGTAIGGTAPYTYAWTSSIDGAIGSTNTFNKSNLSPGSHTITLTVTDSLAATDTDSITITIIADVIPPSILNAKVVPTSGPLGTPFTITADITDPSGVDPTTTIADIQKTDGTFSTTITLFDDGAHSDGAAGDGTYGNTWISTVEGAFFVDITACDIYGNCATVGI